MSHVPQSRSVRDRPSADLSAPRRPRLGRKQILVIGLLLLIGIVNYLDRSTLSIANSSISGELGLSATQMGLLLSVFSWSYAFAQLPVGPLLDRFGARMTLGIGLLLWSVAQAAAGLIQNFGQFLVARIALGLGEGPMFPANAKVVGESFSKEHRGRPIGVTNSASTIGPALAPPLLTWLLLSFGWRTMFVVMGAAGVVLALAWLALYRNPERVAEVDHAVDARHGITQTEAEQASGGVGTGKTNGARPSWSIKEWLFLLRFRTTWSMIGGWVGVIYSVYLYLTWLPAYLEKERGFSVADLGWALVLPYVAGTVGQLFSGVFGDWMVAHTRSITTARKWPVVLGLAVGGAFSVPAALVDARWAAVAFICLAQFFINMASSGGWAMAASLADERTTGSLGSLQNFGGYFGGAFAPLITGMIVDATGSFVSALLISSAVALVAACLYAFGVNRPLPPYPELLDSTKERTA